MTAKNPLRKKVLQTLDLVIDPELHIPITDMGLIYGIDIDENGVVTIIMTLTTIGCPLFDIIQDDIMRNVRTIDDVSDVNIDLTFDPPWTPDMMSESARAEMGLD